MGDFNCGPSKAFWKAIVEAGFTPSEKLQGKARMTKTYHSLGKPLTCIEAIFIPKEWAAKEHKVIKTHSGYTYPSDHFGVRAIVTLKDEQETDPGSTQLHRHTAEKECSKSQAGPSAATTIIPNNSQEMPTVQAGQNHSSADASPLSPSSPSRTISGTSSSAAAGSAQCQPSQALSSGGVWLAEAPAIMVVP